MTSLARILLSAFVSVALTFGAANALAHTSGSSFLSLKATDENHVRAAYDFDLRDLNQLLRLDGNLDGALTWIEIESAEDAIEKAILERTHVRSDGECVVLQREPVSLANHGDGPFARMTVVYRCPHPGASLAVNHAAWFAFDPGHRALLEYTDEEGRTTQTLLTQSSPQWQVAESGYARLRRFLNEGAFHLVTGYDHLAFLGVLLLALARRPKSHAPAPLYSMLKRAFLVITAFTIAHSVTLALAATGKLVLPSKPVEVTIAASVFLAALLNLWRGAGSHGWKLAFAFGLVHGLGFAGALAEMASDGIDLSALAAFNLGIEAAQIAVAAIAVPIIWWLFKNSRNETLGLPVASLSVAALAGFWVVTRLNT